jgi:hypothetical protein
VNVDDLKPVIDVKVGWHVYFNERWHLVTGVDEHYSGDVMVMFADMPGPTVIDCVMSVRAKSPAEWLSHVEAELMAWRQRALDRH